MSDIFRGELSGEGLSFAVVVSKFNRLITDKLLAGAQEAFQAHGAKRVDVAFVPGSVELPVVALKFAKSGRYDAIVCIGSVVRGETDHYEHVAGQAVAGTMRVSLETGIPCTLGVLTTISQEQALDRAGGREGNKGYEAAVTAIEVANLLGAIPTH